MKKIIVAILVIGVLAGLVIVTKNNNDPQISNEDKLTIQKIDSDVTAGGVLLDVRTKDEFESGHIKTAQNLSLQDIQSGIYPAVDKTSPVYVYCRSGNRSSQARAILEGAGFSNVIDLGALTEVQSLGGEVI